MTKWCVPLLALLLAPGAWARTVPLKDVVPAYMGDGLETAIIPTPKQANLGDTCVELTGPVTCIAPAELVAADQRLQDPAIATLPAGRQRDAAISKLGAELTPKGWPNAVGFVQQVRAVFPEVRFAAQAPAGEAGAVLSLTIEHIKPAPGHPEIMEEAYSLEVVQASSGQARITVSGDRWGLLWGIQTLRQMVFRKEGKLYIRTGQITDWPTLWFRGGKRGVAWWVNYKGNASFGGAQWGFAKHRLNTMHGWWIKSDEKTVSELKTALKQAVDAGADIFMIDYNDGDFRTGDNPGEVFPGNPAKTVQYLLEMLDTERKALGSDIKLGYMPAAYSFGHIPFEEGGALKAINGLAKADLLLHNGLHVFTYRYPETAAKTYRDIYGFKGDLILYDCQCLGKPLGAFDLEDKGVYRQLSGLSMQNAPFLYAITGLDYAWNPEAYNPARSLKLACREWVNGDPEAYKVLYDFISYHEANKFVAEYLPRAELLAKEKQITAEMIARLERARPLLEKSAKPGTMTLLSAVDMNSEIGARPYRRQTFEPLMAQYGYKDYTVKRLAGKLTIDGTPDEAAWAAAPAMTGFTSPGYGLLKDSAVKPGLDTLVTLPSNGRDVVARALYDDTGVYLSMTITGLAPKALEQITAALAQPPAAPAYTSHCWRHGPTVELCVNPDFDHTDYWQLITTAPNEYIGFYKQWYDEQNPTFRWDPKPEFKFALRDNTLTFEAKYPFSPQIPTPKPGTLWSVNTQVNAVLQDMGVAMWSFSYDLWYGDIPQRRYGRWRFE